MHSKGKFKRSELTINAIKSMQANNIDLPDLDPSSSSPIVANNLLSDTGVTTTVQTIPTVSELEGTVTPTGMHLPEGPAHISLAAASTRLGRRAGGRGSSLVMMRLSN
jgi:hypothetical protein